LELLPLILNSIDSWDVEFQCLLGDSLKMASENKCKITATNLNKAMRLCLDFVDNLNNDEVYFAWRETFPKLAYQLNFINEEEEKEQDTQTSILEKIVYPKIFSMIERKQEKRRRIRGTELMRDLICT
jgi:hypothetical protein